MKTNLVKPEYGDAAWFHRANIIEQFAGRHRTLEETAELNEKLHSINEEIKTINERPYASHKARLGAEFSSS